MRLLAALFTIVAVAGCRSTATPSSAPPRDPAGGGPYHHCAATTAPPADDPEVASAIPIRVDAEAAIRADERTAFITARPVFATYCVRCHSHSKKVKDTTLEQLDMTSYPFASRHGDAIASEIRTVLGIAGGAPSMPLAGRGCVPDADLQRIAAWADAFERARSEAR